MRGIHFTFTLDESILLNDLPAIPLELRVALVTHNDLVRGVLDESTNQEAYYDYHSFSFSTRELQLYLPYPKSSFDTYYRSSLWHKDRLLEHMLLHIQATISPGYHVGVSPPPDTKLLWIDLDSIAHYYFAGSWTAFAGGTTPPTGAITSEDTGLDLTSEDTGQALVSEV